MKYIHSRGIIHRDISLDNLLIIRSEKIVKISDFGLAKREDEEEIEKVRCGSKDYISPEMIKGESVTAKCDIWALGVILFRLLFGYLPFHCESKEETEEKIKVGDWSFPTDQYISAEARDLLVKILKLDPESRPSASDILSHEFFQMKSEQRIG